MIREAIKAELKRRGWTGYEFAKTCKFSEPKVYEFLAGKRDILSTTADEWLKALGLSVTKKSRK